MCNHGYEATLLSYQFCTTDKCSVHSQECDDGSFRDLTLYDATDPSSEQLCSDGSCSYSEEEGSKEVNSLNITIGNEVIFMMYDITCYPLGFIDTSTCASEASASTCACSTRSLFTDRNEKCDLYVICMEPYSIFCQ